MKAKIKLLNSNKLKVHKFDIIFLKYLNIIILKAKFCLVVLHLPRIFFYIKNANEIKFLFLNKWFYSSFFKQIYIFYKIFFKFYFFRIKLKGLGYRIKKITKKIYRFFLAYNHYFYLFVPKNIYFWTKKRNVLAISIDKIKLNNMFNQLVVLKKLDFYERTKSFLIPNKIVFIKK